MHWMPKPSLRTIVGLAVAAVVVSLYRRHEQQDAGAKAPSKAPRGRPSPRAQFARP
jgi:hypothetical protein